MIQRLLHYIRTDLGRDVYMPGSAFPLTEFLQPEKVVSVLTVTDRPDELTHLGEIFHRSNWRMHSVRACAEAVHFLEKNRVPVIVCSHDLPDGIWTDLLACLENLSDPPVLIVTSPQADEALWAEVLNLGGYDVLPQPFERSEVVRVISLAWLHWKSQRRIPRLPVRMETVNHLRPVNHLQATA
jgi:DNA-binding response OmpR family regulator